VRDVPMPICESHPQRLHYELTGEATGAGARVVLLHHGTASLQSWQKLASRLTDSWCVVAYDRPGFGGSGPVEAWGHEYHRQDAVNLIALLDALGIDRATLIGHSDGATAALLAAAQHPGRILGVVAEAPHVSVEVPRCPDAVEHVYQQICGSTKALESVRRHHGDKGMAVLDRWRQRWCDPSFWDWDVSMELPAIQCPTLVIHGIDDPFFSVAHAEMIARSIAESELWKLAGAQHQPHVEAFEAYTDRVVGFLRNLECT